MGFLEAFNALVGGGSLLFAAAGLWFQTRRIDTVRALRDSLRAIDHSRLKPIWEEDEVLVEYLNYAVLIAGPLKARMMTRFMGAAFIIILSYLNIPGDAPGAIVASIPAFDWSDVVLFVAELAAGVLAPLTVGLDKEEKQFLSNAWALHKRFYTVFVLPAMQDFNDAIESSQAFELVRRERDQEIDGAAAAASAVKLRLKARRAADQRQPSPLIGA